MAENEGLEAWRKLTEEAQARGDQSSVKLLCVVRREWDQARGALVQVREALETLRRAVEE